MKPLMLICAVVFSATCASLPAAEKTLIDYFLPMPIQSLLVSNVWGAPGVFPRDAQNGLEDTTMKQWCYWDGQIIKATDGKYHMFASRWDQAKGHGGWWGSLAVHAVSDNVIGPYIDKGLCWPENQGGKGHNVTALVLPDGRYGVMVSETRPGDVFVSKSLNGPWEHLGSIKVGTIEFSKLGRMSNVSIMVRPDGDFMIVARSGGIWISKTGILGPYAVQGPSVSCLSTEPPWIATCRLLPRQGSTDYTLVFLNRYGRCLPARSFTTPAPLSLAKISSIPKTLGF